MSGSGGRSRGPGGGATFAAVVMATLTAVAGAGWIGGTSGASRSDRGRVTPAATAVVVDPCPPAPAHFSTCMLRVLRPAQAATPDVTGSPPATYGSTTWPTALTPTDVTKAYGFTKSDKNTGTGETIGIVDAYNDPTVASNLATFSSHFGLSQCTVASGCFTQVNETGGSSLPAETTHWDLEISLDVEWVHATAPKAHVLLVEASTNGDTSMFKAVRYAASHAQYVSMSWGGTETTTETSIDTSSFVPYTSSVSFFASAGDTSAAVEYPAASPDVVAVGGTRLVVTKSTGAWESESAWDDGGGGCSTVESASAAQRAFPTYDQSTATCHGYRAIPDVAADATPATGVLVYDSVTTDGASGWLQIGGTSLSSPLWAGHSAAAALHVDATYVYGHSIPFYDVTSGSNGHSCVSGYNLCDGLGSWNSTHGKVNASKPSKPAAPTATAGNGQASVAWAAPTTGGSTITSYTVTSSPTGLVCTWTTGPLSCTVHGLTNATAYTFRVKAHNADGTSATSTPSASVTPELTPPVLDPRASTGAVTLSWAAVSGALSYKVFDSTSSGGEDPSGTAACTAASPATTCSVGSLTDGTPYYFVAEAFTSHGHSAPSTQVAATPVATLTAPTDVHTTAHSTEVTVSWAAVASATGYDVSQAATDGGAPGCSAVAPATECTVDGLGVGETYDFAVRAVHTETSSTPSAEVAATTVAPPVVTTHEAGTGEVTIDYERGTDAIAPSSFSVYEGTASTAETYTTAVAGCAGTASTTCAASGLTTGDAYDFTVESAGVEGTGTAFVTTPSAQVSATPVAVPLGVAATGGAGKVTVGWDAAPGATSYDVYDADASGGEDYSGTAACTTSGHSSTTCTVGDLAGGTTYYFTVVGVNPTGRSTPSAQVTAAPTSSGTGGGGGGGGGGGASGGSGGGSPVSTVPPPPPAPTGTTTAKSATSTTADATAEVTDAPAGVTAVATGAGSLTVAKYTGPPSTATAISTGTGRYVDVEVATGSTFSSLTVTVCGGATASRLEWWDGSVWLPFSSETPAKTGCVTATVSATTTPSLAQLTGTAIATVKQGVTATRIEGGTADATAAKELTTEFTATGRTRSCVGAKPNSADTRPVVLATTKTFPDALAGSYLASSLDTGVLLTPPARLSAATAAALRKEGVTHVVVVGGTLALSASVVSTLDATPAYSCGGGTALAQDVTVTRIGGATPYDTAEMIAEQVAKSFVGTAAFPAAYAGENPTGGDGAYNDTAGTASPAPRSSAPLRTAVLASGAEFQDAMAASGMAYAMRFPVLLTTASTLSPQVAAAIASLTLTQVIVMGGPFAVSDGVVSDLEALGISVVRVAGKDATDTAVELAKFEVAPTGAGLGWSRTVGVAVARANGFTDGLAGSVVTGKTRLPLVLTESPTDAGQYLTTFLQAAGRSGAGIDGESTCKVVALVVLGGQLAIATSVVAELEKELS